jgi:peptidoglycan/xylan/chitin deacetylase (PgdA/CDA1 family)
LAPYDDPPVFPRSSLIVHQEDTTNVHGLADTAGLSRARTSAETARRITVMLGHNFASAAAIGDQLDEFVAWGYETITCDQLAYYLATGNPTGLPAKPMLLTFDDGGASNYTYVYPELVARGMKACFYLISDWMDDLVTVTTPAIPTTDFPDGAPLESGHFTWAQARTMFASGLVEFQSHTTRHRNMTTLSGVGTVGGTGSGAGADFLANKARIEANIPGQIVWHNACPYGASNAVVEAALLAAGCRTSRLVYGATPDSHSLIALTTADTDPMRIAVASPSMVVTYIMGPNVYGAADAEGNLIKDSKLASGGLGWTFPDAQWAVPSGVTLPPGKGTGKVLRGTGNGVQADCRAPMLPLGFSTGFVVEFWYKVTGAAAADQVSLVLEAYRGDGLTAVSGSNRTVKTLSNVADWTFDREIVSSDFNFSYAKPRFRLNAAAGSAVVADFWDIRLKRTPSGSLPALGA